MGRPSLVIPCPEDPGHICAILPNTYKGVKTLKDWLMLQNHVTCNKNMYPPVTRTHSREEGREPQGKT